MMEVQGLVDPKDKKKVIDAIRRGDKSILRRKKPAPAGLKINERREELNQELLKAAKEGDLQGVKDALTNGADANFDIAKEWTPLMHAEKRGHTEIVEILKKAGAVE